MIEPVDDNELTGEPAIANDSQPGMADQTATEVRARSAATGAEIVVLPLRVHEQTGKGVYSQDVLFTVKRLRALGYQADYLHDSDDRYFVTQNSAVVGSISAIALGIASSAAWAGLCALVRRVRHYTDTNLSITITDATSAEPGTTTVSGSPDDVLEALGTFQDRGLLPRHDEQSSDTRLADLGPPPEFSRDEIAKKWALAHELLERSGTVLVAGETVEAEALARRALPHLRSALDWAEDTHDEAEAHERLDRAGRWIRERFKCALVFRDGTYFQSCPVALAHSRVGFSVGGLATRICSLCAVDISECPHDPAEEYLTAGGIGDAGFCRVCGHDDCSEHHDHLLYPASPISIVTELLVDEVSIVSRPAMKDARIMEVSMDTKRLREALRPGFVPGMRVNCDRCLNDCGGLVETEI